MTLEATVVCVDTSDFMRNGDFVPSRLESQQDAVNVVCNNKLNSNAESTVALMSISGRREVLVTLTTDMGKILTSLHTLKPAGQTDFISGVQVATLVLKHRQSKNHRQRIVVFVGSPVEAEEKDLVRLAKKLKKNNVAVDVINFGEENANTSKLEAFINAVNKDDTSHLVTVPSGARMLSDALMGSPILGGQGGGAGGETFAEYGGVDPSLDPELALALRVSMMEERERQKRSEESNVGDSGAPMQTDQMHTDEGVDPELANAIKMSLSEEQAAAPDDGMVVDTAEEEAEADMDLTAMSEEQQIAYALKMSMGEPEQEFAMQPEQPAAAAVPSADIGQIMNDPAFLSDILSTLPGVDPNDEQIQAVLASLAGGAKKDEAKKDSDKK